MTDNETFSVWVNPLQFLEVDEPWATLDKSQPSLEAVIEFLCTPGTASDLDSLIARYKEISIEEKRVFAIPAEVRILEKLIWPLRNAKASYMVGNYLGTISLCGMVAEMVAILIYEISEFRINQTVIDNKGQELLYGRSFERLGQERRVSVLKAINLISDKTEVAFSSIKGIRNKYLHLWSKDHEILHEDAVTAFKDATYLVSQVIGLGIQDGQITLNAALVQYLRKKGIYLKSNSTSENQQQTDEPANE